MVPTESPGLEPSVLSPESSALGSPPWALGPSRFSAVRRVLLQVFFLNLGVAVAKITFGYASGAISILSDGFHSLTDAASNLVGMVGVHAARRPPDEDHPYGHRKYETVAAAASVRMLWCGRATISIPTRPHKSSAPINANTDLWRRCSNRLAIPTPIAGRRSGVRIRPYR